MLQHYMAFLWHMCTTIYTDANRGSEFACRSFRVFLNLVWMLLVMESLLIFLGHSDELTKQHFQCKSIRHMWVTSVPPRPHSKEVGLQLLENWCLAAVHR